MFIKSIADVCIVNPPKEEISNLKGDINVSFVPMSNVSEEGTVDLSEVRMLDRKSTRLNSSHINRYRMPSSA